MTNVSEIHSKTWRLQNREMFGRVTGEHMDVSIGWQAVRELVEIEN